MEQKTVTVSGPSKEEAGLVANLVQLACQFDSVIYLENGLRKVNAKSIMGMMALTLNKGMEVTIYADGTDENDAVEKMQSYLAS